MKTEFIQSADGAKIAYKVYGNGYPLVLVHGMGSNKEMWVENNWIDILKDYFTVITIDTRGHGESDKSYDPDFYSIHNIINDIETVVKKCGFLEFNYFGHSYGATIGLQLCKYNNNIRRVVCAGTTLGNKFFKEIIPEWIIEYEKIGVSKINHNLNELDLTKEDIEWVEKTDIDLLINQFRALNTWEGVSINDIRTNLAMYSGTNDNPHIIDNLIAMENEIQKSKIEFKIFENLDHTDLVSKIGIVSPWVLNFMRDVNK